MTERERDKNRERRVNDAESNVVALALIMRGEAVRLRRLTLLSGLFSLSVAVWIVGRALGVL